MDSTTTREEQRWWFQRNLVGLINLIISIYHKKRLLLLGLISSCEFYLQFFVFSLQFRSVASFLSCFVVFSSRNLTVHSFDSLPRFALHAERWKTSPLERERSRKSCDAVNSLEERSLNKCSLASVPFVRDTRKQGLDLCRRGKSYRVCYWSSSYFTLAKPWSKVKFSKPMYKLVLKCRSWSAARSSLRASTHGSNVRNH